MTKKFKKEYYEKKLLKSRIFNYFEEAEIQNRYNKITENLAQELKDIISQNIRDFDLEMSCGPYGDEG